ncbi:nuclear transport factor 2 family protein [Viridibacillus sp. YIM B01967]|uniref:Nuclear transport factor 2 family protein n=1 Tax=Viridibacillus soli TaxID=2798301 RepID=A0ABS1H5X9_9BACL|nr:nuclear transport factor 2 family protein [Viridibacillus soli]MBK3494818.1 nuclear transport factor 2 family protein [Viridibacillus soli]
MNFKKWLLVTVCALMLAACGNDNSTTKESSGSVNDGENKATSNAVDHGVKDKTEEEKNDVTKSEKSTAPEETSDDDQAIGFEMVDGKVEAATNVPAEEEKALHQAFDEYIEALNAEDVERYSKTLSKNPKGFDIKEDVEYQKLNFENFDIKYTVKDFNVYKYNEKEAQLYANITAEVKVENGKLLKQSAKTNTVFAKEDGKWLVTSVYAMGEKME